MKFFRKEDLKSQGKYFMLKADEAEMAMRKYE
jgi:hypothetical protein